MKNLKIHTVYIYIYIYIYIYRYACVISISSPTYHTVETHEKEPAHIRTYSLKSGDFKN